MSAWTHSICEHCWTTQNPSRTPARITGDGERTCCRCGQTHSSGIYVRQAPESLLCGGQHPASDHNER